MPVMRQTQIDTFDQAASDNFKSQTVEGLRKSFPKHCRALGDDNVASRVDEAFRRARSYGFNSQNGLRLFLELTLLLGDEFDADPQLTWSLQFLRAKEVDESSRVARLHATAAAYLSEVAGRGGVYFDEALAKFRNEPLDSGVGQLDILLLQRFWRLYPQKCRYVGEDALRQLIKGAVSPARDLGLANKRGFTVLMLLMFLLGSGFANDKVYPFAQQVTADRTIADPDARADALRAAAIEFLNRWFSAKRV